MFRITLFCSDLLFFSCNSKIQQAPTNAVDLVQELECAIFIDYSSNTGAYSEILSQIDNFGQIDAIANLERIDSLIICEWVESDKLIGTSHYTPFYVPIVNELTKTILSLKMKKMAY